MKNYRTPREVEQEAINRLSSYSGNEDGSNNYEGENYEGENYIGLDDDGVDFCGAKGNSFLDEGSTGLYFNFSLTNATAAKKTVALTPTYLLTAAAIATATGETVDGVLTDGTIITNLTGAAGNSKLTIAGLQGFILRNPSRIVDMVIVSNTETSFEEYITLQPLSPYRSLPNNKVPLTNYVDPDQLNTKKAIVTLGADYPDFQLNDQNVILLPIGGTDVVATVGVTLKITIRIGGILNPASTLAKKAGKAKQTITKMKAQGLIKPTVRRPGSRSNVF